MSLEEVVNGEKTKGRHNGTLKAVFCPVVDRMVTRTASATGPNRTRPNRSSLALSITLRPVSKRY
jgi:hypothetical protein